MPRSLNLVTALAVAALALAPSFADARAGSGSSFGSRGMRTYSAPPVTNTAPYTASPMERSITPRSAPSYGNPGFGAPYQPGFSRSGAFTSGLLGGLLGAGIGGLLMGHGLFGGGGFGFIGFLLQMLLLYLLVRWLFRMFTHRPAVAGPGMAAFNRMGQPAGPGPGPAAGRGAVARPVNIGRADFSTFEQMLHDVQAAWSAQDLRRLQQLATPEMVSYFGEQLAEQNSRGVRNTVTDVRLEQGDLAEASSEGNREYATVAMRFSMLDVTRDSAGRIVDGDAAVRTMVTELWTFVRAPGGRWLLSAIQQAR
ncbi:MAG: TIM44-like domain-containing protein [Acetobacteraceae bacterium]|nr:TIM44-like domain-containing protein [Acetobacteraceae bacterium]